MRADFLVSMRHHRRKGFSVALALIAAGALSCAAAQAQITGPSFPTVPTSQTGTTATPSLPSPVQPQSTLFGSVSSGQVTPGVLPLNALEAIDRGLKYNLSMIFSEQATTSARGARYKALADVVPNLTSHVGESVQQISLAAFGISLPGLPSIVGPFGVFDARVAASGPFLDIHALNLYRSRSEDVKAAQFDLQNVRDLVVLAVGGVYMQVLAYQARIGTVEAQFATAKALYQQAVDMKNVGMVPAIDVLRSQVELQVQQQRLLAARNDYAKQKLTLARIIGLPTGQEFTLTEKIPVTPAPPLTLDQAIERAFRDRPDYKRAQSQMRSAELNRKAMIGEMLPNVRFNADYGTEGKRPTSSAGVYTAAAALNIPIFQGGKVKGDIMQADALLHQREAAVSDLRGQIEYELRTAFLDLQSNFDQVQVAQSSVLLAEQTLVQSRDRFRAGVATTVEVVQAQEQVAATNDNLINASFTYNVSKLSLARSLGIAERSVKDFLGGKH